MRLSGVGDFWKKFYPASWVPGLREISQQLGTTWGGVHPRMGFVQSEHPARAAAVAAQRSIDIVTRSNQPHVYHRVPGVNESNEHTDKWQMVSPEQDDICYAFGNPSDYVFARTDTEEDYVFLHWPELECCPYAKGVVIAKIPAGETCQ